MLALYKDPEGETVFTSGASMGTWAAKSNAGGESATRTQEQSAELSTLRKRVTELESTLANLKVPLLMYLYHATQETNLSIAGEPRTLKSNNNDNYRL